MVTLTNDTLQHSCGTNNALQTICGTNDALQHSCGTNDADLFQMDDWELSFSKDVAFSTVYSKTRWYINHYKHARHHPSSYRVTRNGGQQHNEAKKYASVIRLFTMCQTCLQLLVDSNRYEYIELDKNPFELDAGNFSPTTFNKYLYDVIAYIDVGIGIINTRASVKTRSQSERAYANTQKLQKAKNILLQKSVSLPL